MLERARIPLATRPNLVSGIDGVGATASGSLARS